MLLIAHTPGQLPFSALMEVYQEENLALGARRWPWESEARQLALAEEEFRDYLESIFFRQNNAMYALLMHDGRALSALRLESYRDGLLLEALSTRKDLRRQGYATALIREVTEYLRKQGPVRIYAHVAKKNFPSLRTHARCGFRKISDSSVYIDGSADSRCVTLVLEL